MQDQNMVVNVIKDQNIKSSIHEDYSYVYDGNKSIYLPVGVSKKNTKNISLYKKTIRMQKFVGANVSDTLLANKYVVEEDKSLLVFNRRKIRQLQIKNMNSIFYRSLWFSKLMNKFIKHGKKNIIENVIVSVLRNIKTRTKVNGIVLFHEALERAKPLLTIVLRRVGRRVYEVPVPLNFTKQYKLAIQWLVVAVRKNNKSPIDIILSDELINTVYTKRSEWLRRKEDIYETVIRNRAYMHYRWV